MNLFYQERGPGVFPFMLQSPVKTDSYLPESLGKTERSLMKDTGADITSADDGGKL